MALLRSGLMPMYVWEPTGGTSPLRKSVTERLQAARALAGRLAADRAGDEDPLGDGLELEVEVDVAIGGDPDEIEADRVVTGHRAVHLGHRPGAPPEGPDVENERGHRRTGSLVGHARNDT